MPLEFIEHEGNLYPKHEAEGGAAVWIQKLAQYYCTGKGIDVGYSKPEWQFPGSFGIEPDIDPEFDAMNFPLSPSGGWDYVHSSHCLEHIKENWASVLDYWLANLRFGGILFLYLPHKSQTYWRSISNRKHIYEFDGSEIGLYLKSLGHKVFVGGCDANHSFVMVCEKVDIEKTAQELYDKLVAEREPKERDWTILAGNDEADFNHVNHIRKLNKLKPIDVEEFNKTYRK